MLERLLGRDARPPVPMVLYTRAGCHLCEVMKVEIRAARLGAPHELTEVDIEGRPELLREHGESIPVLEIGGRRAFKGRLARAALERKFDRLAREWYRAQGGWLMAQLFVLSGPDVGRSFDVQPGDTIGRSPDCIITVRDPSVSRKHARLERDGSTWYVVDDGSRNGVTVGDRKQQRAAIGDKDEFSLGELLLRFRDEAPAPAAAQPAPAAPPPMREVEDDEILLEEPDEIAVGAPTAPEVPLARTTLAPSPIAEAPPGDTGFGPSSAAAGSAVSRGPAGAGDRVLQYSKVQGGGGFSASDLSQYPLWVRASVVLLGVVLMAIIAWLAFQGTSFVKGKAGGGASIEEE